MAKSSLGPGFDVSEIASMLSSMGIPRDFIEGAIHNPEQMMQMMQGIRRGNLQGSGDTLTIGRPNQAVLSREDRFLEQVKLFKANSARELRLPPIKITPLPRWRVLEEFTQFRPGGAYDIAAEFQKTHIRQTYIGMSQTFSQKELDDLERITLSEMLIRKTHNGSYFLCRVISKSMRLVAVSVAVEDPCGDVTKVAIYNYPCTFDASVEETDRLFPIGSILAIREPTYKFAVNGDHPMVRIDSPSDIIFIDSDSELLRGVHWTTGSIFGDAPKHPLTSEGWRTRGVEDFKAKRWLSAAICFTEGLKLDPSHHVLRLNRAEACLRLGWFNSALGDADEVLKAGVVDENLSRKAVFRAAKASYMIGKYARAMELAALRPNDNECHQWASKAQQRMHESSTGEYDWCLLFRESQRPAARPDVADYTGPVEVKKRSGLKGVRGVFVTRDVKIGELLMVSKPIASDYPEDNPNNGKEMFLSFNFLTDKICERSRFVIITRIVQKIWDDSNLASTLRSMFAGPNCATPLPYPALPADVPKRFHPQKPVCNIDITRVEGVASFNSFTLQPLEFVAGTKTINAKKDTGSFYGDVMVIRASQNLRKDDEVTVEYFPGCSSLEDRDKRTHWKFICDCALCAADRADDCSVRSSLVSDWSPSTTVPEAEKILMRVKETYGDHAERRRCGTKPDLFIAYRILADAYKRQAHQNLRYCKLAIEARMNSLESIGMVITDRSILGRIKQKNSLPVDITRGPTHYIYLCTMSVITVVAAFNALGEARRARNWLKVAVWLEDIHVGGGKALFVLRFTPILQDLHLMHVLEENI
ncbi:hypothetical protein DFH11DRAFT_11798 [Phellopilus nigrolimitatus]|nr:hypothetical protein DFH11DRAFT_11798 [Phellopilus nigrolimitatus]